MQCSLPVIVPIRGNQPRKTVSPLKGGTRTSSISITLIEQASDLRTSVQSPWRNADALATRAAATNGYAFSFRCEVKAEDMQQFSPLGMRGVFVQGGLVRSQMQQIRDDIKTVLEAQKEAQTEPDNQDRQATFKQRNKAFKTLYGNLFPECNFAKAEIASWFQRLSEYWSRLDGQHAQTVATSPH